MLPVGTRSVLYGVHHWLIHPLLLTLAWTRLYGFPRDARLLLAFFVHDLGYIGKTDIDGEDGETHVEWGANFMRRHHGDAWGNFCLFHSRFYAQKHGGKPSRLCVADKYVIAIEPWWLYLPRAWLSGELWEYVGGRLGQDSKYAHEPETGRYSTPLSEIWADPGRSKLSKLRYWHAKMADSCNEWVHAHKDGADDAWTAAK